MGFSLSALLDLHQNTSRKATYPSGMTHAHSLSQVPLTQERDPVCGMLGSRTGPHRTDYAGRVYYFCSAGCKSKFAADPIKFTQVTSSPAPAKLVQPTHSAQSAQSAHSAQSGAVPGTLYTCPMHPEVVKPAPGDCPLCGMALVPMGASNEAAEATELTELTRRMWVGIVLSIPLVMLAMSPMIGIMEPFGLRPTPRGWVEFALSTPVVGWVGAPIMRKFWLSLQTWSLNMYSLIGLGVGLAFGFSLVALLFPEIFPLAFREHDGAVGKYFEAAAVIVTLVILGDVLQMRAMGQTSQAIKQLLKLAPNSAWRLQADDSEQQVELDAVRVGDRLRIKPGERIPVDGIVIAGSSHVDESMISGEPIPVGKKAPDHVTGATINGSGSLLMRAERVGAETLLARIIGMVQAAQRTRAPIQRLADLIAAYFVQIVVAVALLSGLAWWFLGPEPRFVYALVNAVAVLIIACPCALGLATPISMTVAMGRGAQSGILFRNAEAIERMRDIDTVVIDKTGTLTLGKPALVDLQVIPGIDEREALGLVASVEQLSEHPIATAVVAGARDRGAALQPATGFDAANGKGVTANVAGRVVAIGSGAFLAGLGIDTTPLEATAQRWRAEAKTVVFFCVDGVIGGVLAVADPVKDSTPQALAALKRSGIRVAMVTGDARATAEAIAKQLGIDEVFAEVLPEHKAIHVKALQEKGHKVAMAGDGINDAPALAQADVGIAMGTGTDVAMEAASVTLVKGDLRGIARAATLSRATMRNIKQNLFFAFFYNTFGIPIAAGVLYPVFGVLLSPIIAGVAMSASSVSVVTNALRLKRVDLE